MKNLKQSCSSNFRTFLPELLALQFFGNNINSRTGTQNDFIIGSKKALSCVLQGYELDKFRSISVAMS